MSRFLKVFLRDPLNTRIQVAGFGKHPAWDDHIDDIGLTTETLVLAKQLLYSGGIAAHLASGAWDQIEKSGNAIEFDHRFVWGRDQQAIVGAIWASADRKGRTRFPLVICAQSGFDGPRAVDLFLDSVEQLGTLCRTAKTKEEIIDAFDQAQELLGYSGSPATHEKLFSEIKESAEDSILPALVTLAAGLKSKRLRGSRESAGSHFRLAAISSQAKDNLSFWSAYLNTQPTGSGLPYIVIAAKGKGWIDLIVGEPLQNDFFCLRANENALPATWIEILGTELSKWESEARDYLRTYRLSPANDSTHRRSWWSGLFDSKNRKR
jgi:hypothetical protein